MSVKKLAFQMAGEMPDTFFSLSLALVSIWNKEYASSPGLSDHSEKRTFGSCSASLLLLLGPASQSPGHKG